VSGRWGIVALTFAGAFIASLVLVSASQTPGGGSVAVDNDDIGGVVTGARAKPASGDRRDDRVAYPFNSVVTDDRGRFWCHIPGYDLGARVRPR
jgi:hypothetical protein